jgi:hypothetical protein
MLLALFIASAAGPPSRLAVVAVVVAGSSSFYGAADRQPEGVVPQGRLAAQHEATPAGLAYIDASHLEGFSDLDWGFDAINGLALNLNRNGYLALSLPKITPARLAQAELLVLIAPAKPFSFDERRYVREFVTRGGVLICTVGAEDSAGSQPLLAEFGLSVPRSPVPTAGDWREPGPMGRFRAIVPELDPTGRNEAGVRFHAGWPVTAEASHSEVLVTGQRNEPIVVLRAVGRGRVVLIGDSHFPLNKNLEYITGDPFEGAYENADFWRWLLRRVTKPAMGRGLPSEPVAPIEGDRREERT